MDKLQYPIVETGTHIEFRYYGPSETGKTSVWAVFNINEEFPLGVITWFGRWRKYAFTTEQRNVYEETCLREIASFIERKTKEHKNG